MVIDLKSTKPRLFQSITPSPKETKNKAITLIELTHSSCRYRDRYSARFFIK